LPKSSLLLFSRSTYTQSGLQIWLIFQYANITNGSNLSTKVIATFNPFRTIRRRWSR